jgi:hypothetical protein
MANPNLPANIPADTTPQTYSGTLIRAYLLDLAASQVVQATVTNSADVAANAVSAQLSSSVPTTLPAGTVLTFGAVNLTLTADASLTGVASAVAIASPHNAVLAAATASYSNLVEIPLTEDMQPTVGDDEETIKVQNRATPIRSTNGKDLTATIKTVSGLTNVVVKRMVGIGTRLSPANRARVVWIYPDGFAIMATVNLSHTPEGMVGKAVRHAFKANLTGDLLWANLNDAVPAWTAYS